MNVVERHTIRELHSGDRTREGLLLCPWIDETEWKAVCSWLYGDSPAEQRRGVDRVAAWRSRGVIPFPVESTADVVDCLLRDDSFSAQSTDEARSLMFAMVITRFVNGVFDYGYWRHRRGSIQNVVVEYGVPFWLVSLRHESTHRALPSLSVLQKGVQFVYKWLWANYWEHQYTELPTSDTTGLIQKIPSSWQAFDKTLPSKSLPTKSGNAESSRQLAVLKEGLKEYKELKQERKQQVIKKIYKSLASAEHVVFAQLLRDRLFLSPFSSQTEQSSFNTKELSQFPILSSSLVNHWIPLLEAIGRYRSSAKTNLIEALIITCHNDYTTDHTWNLILAGWIGLLLNSPTHELIVNSSAHYNQVDLTQETSVMNGDIRSRQLLCVSRNYPGPYTLAINKRLINYNVPSDAKLPKEAILRLSALLSISESLSSCLSPLPLLCECEQKRELDELKERIRLRSESTTDTALEEEREDSVWKKANGFDWYNCPVGCVPGQQLTPLTLDLPDLPSDTAILQPRPPATPPREQYCIISSETDIEEEKELETRELLTSVQIETLQQAISIY